MLRLDRRIVGYRCWVVDYRDYLDYLGLSGNFRRHYTNQQYGVARSGPEYLAQKPHLASP